MSRFGVMFFAGPAAAFANIARGLRPGGGLVFVCWQNFTDNEWIVVFGGAAAMHVALPPLDDPSAPGMFSLGRRDRIAAMLCAAAFTDVAIESVVEPLWMGADVVDAVTFLKSTGIWSRLIRDAEPPTVARVSEAVAAALEPYLTVCQFGHPGHGRERGRLGDGASLVQPPARQLGGIAARRAAH